jgi:hypothetical protein
MRIEIGLFNRRMSGWKLLSWALAALALFGVGCRSSNPQAPAQRAAPQASVNAGRANPANPPGAGVIRSEIGFASRRKFREHYEKHGSEFGAISEEEYLRQAQILRDSPVGGNILEVTRGDGVITRFDRKTDAFLAFDRDLTIRTYFKPNDGERYFVRQSKRQPRNE